MLGVPVGCLPIERQVELRNLRCFCIGRAQILGHMVSLPCGEGSANMRFCVSTLIVSKVGVVHCVDVRILLYHRKEVIIGLVDLRGASSSRGGIGNHGRLGVRFWRQRLRHERGVDDAPFLFGTSGCCPSVYSFGMRHYNNHICLLRMFIVDSQREPGVPNCVIPSRYNTGQMLTP